MGFEDPQVFADTPLGKFSEQDQTTPEVFVESFLTEDGYTATQNVTERGTEVSLVKGVHRSEFLVINGELFNANLYDTVRDSQITEPADLKSYICMRNDSSSCYQKEK